MLEVVSWGVGGGEMKRGGRVGVSFIVRRRIRKIRKCDGGKGNMETYAISGFEEKSNPAVFFGKRGGKRGKFPQTAEGGRAECGGRGGN